MANAKIPQLPSAAPLTGIEPLPIVQNGETVKTTVQDIANLSLDSLQIAANGGVEFNNSSELSTIYNSTITSGTSQSIGGLSQQSASYWQNKTIVQVIDNILFPLQEPNYVIPTIAFSTSNTVFNLEVGSPLASISLTGSGTKNDAGVYNNFIFYKSINGGSASSIGSIAPGSTSATALPNQFSGLPNQNNPNYLYTSVKTDTSYSGGFQSPSGTNASSQVVYSLLCDYAQGNFNYKSDGVLDSRTRATRQTDRAQSASNNFAPNNTITFNGYFPVYYGTSTSATKPLGVDVANAILTGVGASKVTPIGSSMGDITIPFGVGSTPKWMWFAVYVHNTEKTKWYNSDMNQGVIGSGLFDLPITQAITSQQGYWTNQNFRIYVSSYKSQQFGNYIMSN